MSTHVAVRSARWRRAVWLAVPLVALAIVWRKWGFLHKRAATVVLHKGDQVLSAADGAMQAAEGDEGAPDDGPEGSSAWVAAPAEWATAAGHTLSRKEIDERCAGTKGNFCRGYYVQTPVPATPPPTGNKTCLWGCNFVGQCDHAGGWCRCPAGWQGDSCSMRMRRPCSQVARPIGSFEPNREPFDWQKQGMVINSRCAQLCDDDIGYCFCNQTMKYGRLPAPLDAPPGTPPVRRGRPLGFHCQPSVDPEGKEMPFGWGDKKPDELWGPEGWCNADRPATFCPCILDGFAGEFCDEYKEPFCANQCNGHGECNQGFCKCHDGWWGQDCAHRTAGTPWSPGYEAHDRPWTKEHVHTPASRDPEPGATRLRPLIYVYELPPMFNQVLLQYRMDQGTCVHRTFNAANGSEWHDGMGYLAEPGLHEILLQSEHRTLNPEEADYFYIPVYSSCYIYPIHGFGDFPWFHATHKTPRVHAGVNMLIEVYHWIRSHHPWWDRSGGTDHIVLQSHDEGSCWLPAVLRPAVLLTHWGRMDRGHKSNTGYIDDLYHKPYAHPLYMPEGTEGKLGDFPCYDPKKDLVIPPMASPRKYGLSPLLGAPARNRTIRAFFKGRIQPNNKPYSRGIRQTLAKLCSDEGWWKKHGMWVGETNPPDHDTSSYGALLASSVFCFVLPGDGFSPRFEDAMLHGCIPVIIQDDVHLGFESILDFSAFALRIPQADMHRAPDIIGAVPLERVEAMQRALGRVWRKWAYTGYRPYRRLALDTLAGYAKKAGSGEPDHASLPHPERSYEPGEGDAVEVIYSWLYARIPYTRGPPEGERRAGSDDGSADKPAADETPTGLDVQPHPTAEEPKPAAAAEDGTPAAAEEQAQPTEEQAQPAAEEAKPAAEAAKPEAEEAKPAAEEAKPATEDAKPAADEAKPATEEAKPAAEEAKPATEEAKPAAEEAKPATEEAKPAAEEGKPAAEETKPAAKEAKPAAEEAKPAAAEEAKPAAEEAKPAAAEEAKPAAEEAKPAAAAEEPKPANEERAGAKAEPAGADKPKKAETKKIADSKREAATKAVQTKEAAQAKAAEAAKLAADAAKLADEAKAAADAAQAAAEAADQAKQEAAEPKPQT